MDALPAGWYNVAMDQSEHKPTKDGSGAYLECRFTVLDGQFKDRKVFSRFNVRNNNPQAVEIAYKQLSALCHAVGVLQVPDSQLLHGRPLKVKLSVRPADGQYEASNEVKAYRNINDQSVGNTGAPQGAVGPAMDTPAATPFPAPMQMPQAAPAGAQPAWQPPAAAQPWAGQPQQQQPAPQQYAPQPQGQLVQQYAPPAAAPAAAPPWAQQPGQAMQAPVGAPGGMAPPWAGAPAA